MQYFNNRSEETDSPSLSNSRLQKAIERNRARMQKKEGLRPPSSSSSTHAMRGVPLSRRNAVVATKASASARPARKSWNKLEADQSVENRLEKLRQKRASRVSKLSTAKKLSTTPKRSFNLKNLSLKKFILGEEGRPTYLKWLTRLSWLGLISFFLHVCFGSRGALEYYTRVHRLEKIKKEIKVLKEENNSLVYEINQIENSRSFQRKVVRDYLGYISKDEYLIIFPETTLL